MASQNYSESKNTPRGAGTHAPAGQSGQASDAPAPGGDVEATVRAAVERGEQDPRDGVPGVGRGLDEDTGTDTISGFDIGSNDRSGTHLDDARR
jgi:hypothetical protein